MLVYKINKKDSGDTLYLDIGDLRSLEEAYISVEPEYIEAGAVYTIEIVDLPFEKVKELKESELEYFS